MRWGYHIFEWHPINLELQRANQPTNPLEEKRNKRQQHNFGKKNWNREDRLLNLYCYLLHHTLVIWKFSGLPRNSRSWEKEQEEGLRFWAWANTLKIVTWVYILEVQFLKLRFILNQKMIRLQIKLESFLRLTAKHVLAFLYETYNLYRLEAFCSQI